MPGLEEIMAVDSIGPGLAKNISDYFSEKA